MKLYKKDFQFSYAIGVSPTLELTQNFPDKVQRILIDKKGVDKNQGVKKIMGICREKNLRVEQVDSISQGENSYALAIFNKFKKPIEAGNHLVLISPSDKGNLGTIIRSMSAFNLKNLAIVKPSVDIFDPKVIRASMGTMFKINFEYFDNFNQYKAQFRENNFYPFMTNGKYLLPKVTYREPFSLIFGNEGSGLGREFLGVGESVRIPQNSEIDSLNLAVAVSLGLYQQNCLKK